MAMLIVRHQVEDFDRWRAGYDANADVRTNGGVRHQMVYRSATTGVVGAPQIWFVEEA